MAPLAVLVMLTGGISAAIAQQQGDLSEQDAKKQLEHSRDRLNQVRSREKGVRHNVKALREQNTNLNRSLIDTAGRIQASETSLSGIEGRLVELAAQENIIRGSLAQRHGRIAQLLAAMQRISRQPPPVIVTPREDALQMVRSAMLLAALFPELRNQADQLSQKLSDLIRVTTSIRLQRDRLKIENGNLNKNQKQIRLLLAEKRSRLNARQSQLASLRAAAEQHARNVANLSDLIDKLSTAVEQKSGLGKYERELATAARNSGDAGGPPAGSAKTRSGPVKTAFANPGRIKPAIPFVKTRGTLPRPVRGRLVRTFDSRDSFGARTKGIVFATRKNAQITSPADGWIVYSGNFRSYGQLLIINAGGGYHVLLAGMKRIEASLGQFVLAGEPIASMGASKRKRSPKTKSSRPVLYVEFRKDGQPIDPGPWFASGKKKVQG